METLKYVYKPKAATMAFATVFFAVCTAILFNSAQTNDRGLIIDGLITLDTGQATLFFGALLTASAAMTVGGLFGIVMGMISTQTLTMDDKALRMPKSGLSHKIVSIAYGDIVKMTMVQVKSQRFLTIEHRGGKVSISRSMLPTNAIFDKVCNVLSERVAAARQIAPSDPGLWRL